MISGHSLIDLLYDHRYAQWAGCCRCLPPLFCCSFQIAIQCFVALGMRKVLQRSLALRLVVFAVAMVGAITFLVSREPCGDWSRATFLCLPMIIFHCVRHGLFDLRRELLFLPMVVVGMILGWALMFSLDNHRKLIAALPMETSGPQPGETQGSCGTTGRSVRQALRND
jgi:hypothetical protein